jgi:Ca2+/Na+ antiporter
MELDNLKDVWRDLGTKDRLSNDAEISSMLFKRSQSPVAKMKRNLRLELIAIIFLYTLTIWYYIAAWEGRYWEVALLLFLVGVFFLFYYNRKNKLLNEMQCVACEVRSNLQRQLTTLEKYVNFYFVTGTLLTPIVYFVAGLIVFFKTPPNTGEIHAGDSQVGIKPDILNHVADHRFFIEFLVIGVALSIGSYFMNRWYVNKLYGQHIYKLKELLKQMEETD